MGSSSTCITFPLHDEFNMEASKKVDELVNLINIVNRSDVPFKTLFFRFIRENMCINKCDNWFMSEKYKINRSKKEKILIDSLFVLTEAAKCKKYWPDLNEEENFNLLRGLALELYLEKCITKRYADVFGNCMVSIDGKHFTHKAKAYPRTLDVVGWDYEQCDGELFECKVYAFRLMTKYKDKEKLAYLISLQNFFIKAGSKARVGIASFENDLMLRKEFGSIGNTIMLVGYQKLLYIEKERCG